MGEAKRPHARHVIQKIVSQTTRNDSLSFLYINQLWYLIVTMMIRCAASFSSLTSRISRRVVVVARRRGAGMQSEFRQHSWPSTSSASPRHDESNDEKRYYYTHSNAGLTTLSMPYYYHQHHQHPRERQSPPLQRRAYHTTTPQPLVLYGSIIVLSAAGYVIWRKARGEPITPYSLTDAKRTYEEHEGKFSRTAFAKRQAEKLKQAQHQQQNQNQQQMSSTNDGEKQK